MIRDEPPASGLAVLGAMPGGIWALGAVSLCMDASSELIHSLLPLFMVSVLGTSALSVGLVEGIAEATAAVTKVFSGGIADRFGRRKLMTVIGYGLAALSKPLFPLADSLGWVLAARFADRVGKGIRGAPRDAMVGDLAPPALRGAAYGLRQAMDTVGAMLGPLAAVGLMAWLADDIRAVLWAALVPAALAVLVLVLFVREPPRPAVAGKERPRLSHAALCALGSPYWRVVAVAAVFSLARFSEAFLLLRARSAHLPETLVPLVLVAMNLVYSLSAYPAGHLSDRLGRRGILVAGFAVLVLADLVLAVGGIAAVMVGVALWGLHMGLTQGLLAALVADTAPAAWRATAFGVFNLVSGLAQLAASLGAGALWDGAGPAAPFLAGAAVAAIALASLAALDRPPPAARA